MLSKLIKHEWKSTSKMGIVTLLTLAGMTLVGTLGIALPVNYFIQNYSMPGSRVMSDQESMYTVFATLTVMMSFMLIYLTFLGVAWGMIIYHSVRFFKTMYSEEGYLTHTLPVTPAQLLVSKTLVAGMWYFLVELGIILSVCILVGALLFSLSDSNMAGMLREFGYMWDTIEKDAAFGLTAAHMIILVVMALLVTPFSMMMTIFGSLTVGQLSRKYKAFMGILVYIGVMFVTAILSSIFRTIFMISAAVVGSEELEGFFLIFGNYDMTILLSAGMAVGFYFISHYILKSKLNLE